MIHCINPWCPERQNPDNLERCLSCGTELLINERYRLIRPLKDVFVQSPTEVWLVDCCGTPKVLKSLTENKPTLVKLFQREAQVLRLLSHKGIPHIETDFTFFPSNGPKKLLCLVMETVEGENLEEWIANHGSISQDLALQWLIELTEILDYLHQQRFFHRDIKPSNIMRTPDGKLVLIDFGTVRKITGTYLEKMDRGLDTTGIYSIGGYTPAEQLLGRAVPQSDFFSLGRTFVYLLTAKPPTEFESSEMGELIQWKDSVFQLSPALADLIDELMVADPEKRPRTPQDILCRLEKINLSVGKKPSSQKPEAELVDFGSFASTLLGNKLESKIKIDNKSLVYLASFSLFFMWGFYGFGGFKPVASFLNQRGLENKVTEKWDKAEWNYNWAIRLSPNYAEAHYNLGSLYEESHQLSLARKEYKIAAIRGLPYAQNNLGRLDILAGNYDAAVDWFLKGLKQAKDNTVKYTLHKNLGWARVKQKRYEEAEAYLRSAIELDEGRAAAHCWLAQALEGQNQVKAARKSWENCLRYASSYNPDEDAWINIARQRLAEGDKP